MPFLQANIKLNDFSRQDSVSMPFPGLYMNQPYCQLTRGDKTHWSLHENTTFFIRENAFENVVWKCRFVLALICEWFYIGGITIHNELKEEFTMN